MSATLLRTKLYRPAPRSNLVDRTRLVDKLERGLAGTRLVLVSAPPGFGKTTLITDWIERCGYPAAWLSLDAHDNDPVRFLSYLIAALQTVSPGLGEAILDSLASTPPPPVEPLLTLLVNECCDLSRDTLLVLDDYHAIEASAVHSALTFLIDHLPPPVHLVITTRVDPPLPLARYRARDQLVEIRTDDLRFTPDEAALFLNRAMGLALSGENVTSLQARTEGWVVGLQMAALSIQGLSDPTRFIQTFSGSNRFILDYLLEEVLRRQSVDLQYFLLCTSVLDRLTGPLCDAVTNQTDSQARLYQLERDNLFVISLDSERRWFRYHHLFRDLLCARLEQFHQQDVPALHARAAEWYEQNGMAIEAVSHALIAKDFARAARVMEESGGSMHDAGLGLNTFLDWVGALPRDELIRHSILCFRSAFIMILTGHLEEAEMLIREAEEYLANQSGLEMSRLQNARAWAAYARTYYASFRGDFETALEQALYALAQIRAEDVGMRSSALSAIGELYAVRGELDEARRWLSQAIPYQLNHGRLYSATNSNCRLAEIFKTQGRLMLAVDLYQQSFRLLAERGDKPPGCIGMVEAGLGDLLRERNQLEQAQELLVNGLEHTRMLGRPYEQSLAYLACILLRLSQKDLGASRELAREGEELAQMYPAMLPVRKRIDLGKVRVWLAAGELGLVSDWARERKLVDGPLDCYREPERLALARLYIAQGRHDDAIRFLERLEEAAGAGGRTGRLIEIHVLQAVALSKVNKTRAALLALEKALVLAEPECYVRVFLDEGELITSLLHRFSQDNPNARLKEYATSLLSPGSDPPMMPSPGRTAGSGMFEHLSPRELEVLGLVAQGFSNREIAERLFISLPTVKKHVENIHGKLGVKNRSQAILRAQELKLL